MALILLLLPSIESLLCPGQPDAEEDSFLAARSAAMSKGVRLLGGDEKAAAHDAHANAGAWCEFRLQQPRAAP
jgi:hypothetical protein